ncbi:MAG: sigma-70 family RNA polymerase sigma factor [Candidatus Sumerlaeota bacterium]|nr:sigma-70 family RNA polymerase sigma factor [Candidatus Sumerlaeota bacterium]
MDDRSLATAAAKGDAGALATLVERYRRYVYAIAWRIALNEEDALDIAQNAFVRMVERIGDYNGRGEFRSWLATIAARQAYDFLRRPERREEPAAPEQIERLSDARQHDARANPRRALETADRRRQVEEAMALLSPQQRAILALRLFEDIGAKEIAERLGLPEKQTRSQLSRAIARIREALR